MRIHTVENGENIFSIARKYAIPPTKIIEHNELSEPDRLTRGQRLLILTPTRTHTTRGGDTLDSLAIRYSVSEDALLAANPHLLGERRCYPGKILSVKYDLPRYGVGIGNGFYFEGCSRERLMTMLPYISYLTVSAGKWERGTLGLKFKTRELTELSRKAGKLPILRIFAKEGREDFFKAADRFIEEIPDKIISEGFSGISLAAFSAAEDGESYADFLIRLKRAMMERDLTLSVELDANRELRPYSRFADIADTVTLNYEKCFMKDIPSFAEAEARVLSEYAELSAPERSFIELPAFAYSDGDEISKRDAELLARKTGAEILYDPERMVCHFAYNKYSAGKRRRVSVSYPSLENVAAQLDLIGRLGYMGVSFDIMRTPLEYVLCFYAAFNRTGVTLNSKKEGCLRE